MHVIWCFVFSSSSSGEVVELLLLLGRERGRGGVCCFVVSFLLSSISGEVVRQICWAEAHEKIARMTLTIKLDRNWSSFQLANSAPPLSVTDSAIAPSARI